MTTHPSIRPGLLSPQQLDDLATLAQVAQATNTHLALDAGLLAGLLGHIAAMTATAGELCDALDSVVRCPAEGIACPDCARLAAAALADAREMALFGEGAARG